MRKPIVLIVIAVMAASVLAGCSGSTPPTAGSSGGSSSGGSAQSAAVEMSGFAFTPASVEVAVGGTVTWTNKDSATHTVKGEGWGSGDVASGATYSNTFDKAGTYPYACSIHPSMTGTVVVK
jgi:plastocyanin